MKIDRHIVLGALGLVLAVAAVFLYGLEISRLPSLSDFEGQPVGGDFPQFWACARLVWQHMAESAYVPPILTPEMALVNKMLLEPVHNQTAYNNPLYYPPVYLLFLAPFGGLAYFPALISFFAATAAVYFAGLWQLLRIRWLWCLMLGFSAVWLNLVVGQNGLLTAGLLAFALAFLNRSPTLAGIFFGLLCYKPHLGLLVPLVLLAGGHWRAFFFAAVTVIGLMAYSLIVLGLDSWILWLDGANFAAWALEHQAVLWKRMPTVYALLRLQGVASGPAMLAQLGMILSVAVAVIWIWWRTENHNLRGAALAVGLLLVTLFVYDYDYAILGLAFALLVREAERTGWRWADRILLPLAFIWPVMINKLVDFFYEYQGSYLQLGFVLPLLLLILMVARARGSALEPVH